MTEGILGWLAQSAVAALLLGAAIYLCRSLIEARLTRSVQYEFDKKLATFKNELEADAKRLEALRSAAFGAQLAQRNALAAKRLESAHELWNGVVDARKGVAIAMNLEVMNIPAVIKEANDPRMQTFLRTIASGEVMKPEYAARIAKVAIHQPFVSQTVWALFAVYTAIITYSIAKMQIIQGGYDPDKFLRASHWAELLEDVLPPDDLARIGTSAEYGVQWTLKRLEDLIVAELRRSVAEEVAGFESLASAQRILAAADHWVLSTSEGVARAKAAEAGVSEIFKFNPK